MANVTNLKQGSRGDDVVKLQKALIDAGYNVGSTGADGVLGKNTAAAIKQYQKDNGLQVDGIAGKNTQGLLYSAGTTNNNAGGNAKANNGNKKANAGSNKIVDGGAKEPIAGTPKVEEPKVNNILYGNFTPEEVAAMKNQISEASNLLSQAMSGGPGEYQFGEDYYKGSDYLNQYENRGPFSYDFNSDALYQQYKDQYIQQGQLAMMDTMGQAAAMTGGYGNSYAQTVGQQMYNQQLSQLNEVMPELYGMAYDRYNQEGQDMLNMYNLYMGREQDNYNKWQDSYNMWLDNVSMLKDNYTTLYNQYTSAYDQNYLEGQDTKKWEYQDSQDAKAEQETNYNRLADLIQNTGYKPSAEELEAAGMTSGEANALKGAYNTYLSSLQKKEEPKAPEYTVLDYEEQAKWEKKFDKATSLADVERYADQMEAAKVDPKIVASWVDYYSQQFIEDEPKYPHNYKIYDPENVGGGGGGGTTYARQW